MTFSPLPRLRTATSSKDCIEYSTGAKYIGNVEGKRRKGSGTFYWPNGAKYEGEFLDNYRQGQGLQQWADGSSYEGTFKDDLRHGQGTQMWQDGSKYTGTFFRDRRHGKGVYTWADNSSFVGTFYTDKREGYGKLIYSNGNVFEGLYRKDERFGPGVFTYTDGRQDVGLWVGERLVKLLSKMEDNFSMAHHSELDYCQEDHRKMIRLENRHYNKKHILDHIIHPPPAFNYAGNENLEENSKAIFSDSLHPDSFAMDCEVFENEFFDAEGSIDCDDVVEAVNGTPLLIEMQRHIHRHRQGEKALPFSVSTFEHGPRTTFKSSSGDLEVRSRELMEACLSGNKDKVQSLLLTGELSPDVSDCTGFTPLQAAVTNCHQSVINLLLDAGADINRLNDEGLSALAQCFVYYYPVDSFKENIAEKEYLIAKTNGSDDENGHVEVVAMQPSNSDVYFYHYIRRDRFSVHQHSNESLFINVTRSKALVLNGSTNKLSSKEELAQTKTEESNAINKAPSAAARDSGFESRKETQLAPTSEGGASSAVTPASLDSREVPPSHVTSQIATPAVSERDKSPSVISHITANTREPSEGADDLTTDDEEKVLRLRKANSKARHKVSLTVTGPDDDVSLLSSQAMSNASNKGDLFLSDATVMNYGIKVKDDLIDRCATALSHNEMVTKRDDGSAKSVERTRLLAQRKAMKKERWETMQLLLKRGANPNVCSVPMPALVFTIKAGDMEATKLLLLKGADANLRLPEKKGGLSPLHLAAGTPGEEGILITEYLLNALSNPDARATADNSYLDPADENKEEEFDISDGDGSALGRTPLHIACSRDDDYPSAANIVHLLLDHKADADVLCNGHSPLSLAVISGNDEAISELLKYGANPSLRLTHGNGNALCVASHTAYEYRRSPDGRIDLIDKLVLNGADILAYIPIGPKKVQGTALDYAYHIFNLDRRIAHMPYHALSYSERETYNARRRLLGHMGDVVREKCIERERKRIEDEIAAGVPSRSPSARFSFIGAGVRPNLKSASGTAEGQVAGEGRVKFDVIEKIGDRGSVLPTVRKPLFKYCYECGRSVNVRLTACTRCKEVYFCSKNCKVKAWNARHKDECVRMQGSKNPSRAASHAKSAPAKFGGRGQGLSNVDPRRAAKMDKSYNMLRRPTDKVLVPRKHLSHSQPALAHGKHHQSVRHNQGGGRMSPDLTPFNGFIDNYSFN